MTERKVDVIIPAERAIDDGDMRLFRALPSYRRESVGPFVFVDHYKHRSRRGIGDRPHPHAGIEVLSYLLDGGVEHRDSKGFRDRLGAGDAQWIAAGKGIIHAETPEGGRHGLQLWTSLPPDKMLMEPSYKAFRAAEIPTQVGTDFQLHVVAGEVNGVKGPIVSHAQALMARLVLEADARLSLKIAPQEELGIYVISGGVVVAGESLRVGELAVLTAGDTVTVSSTQEGGEALVIGGPKINYPLVFDGPFVMDSEEAIEQAYHRYHTGGMGKLEL